MTTAVCYKCGKFKTGAFTPCTNCGAMPKEENEFILSLALTDHFFDKSSLQDMGADIETGVKIQLEPETQQVLLQKIQEPETASMLKWLKELYKS
jgi:hypothetical protein